MKGNTRELWFVMSGAVLVVALFVGLSILFGQAGFPLDDAWIHQTYARNLVRDGRWEYTPGTVSAGSTAPLWTIMLALGYVLRLPFRLWAYLLGTLSLGSIAWSGMRLWRIFWPTLANKAWLAGAAIPLSFQLIWAAASGMESLLFTAVGLWILVLFVEGWRDEVPLQESSNLATNTAIGGTRATTRRLSLIGLLSGLLVLTRPEGVVLLFLVALALFMQAASLRRRLGRLLILFMAAAVPILPYVAFNLSVSGTLWPNTMYAKQSEYAILLEQPFLSRLARLLFYSLGGPETGWRGSSGAHLFLIPGVIVSAWAALKADWSSRRILKLLPLLWAGGHVFLYAWRLPLTYQHGRYLLPALPIWIIFGTAGWVRLLARLGSGRYAILARRVTGLSFFALLLVFVLLGAQAYATDVAFIEGEMVTTAHWIAEHTPADALIASHDIGAIGYFAGRPLLDLAGLITPDIIPWLSDEAKLSRYVLESDADYLVTAPGWPYVDVAAADSSRLIFSTGYEWTTKQGLNNMKVYELSVP